MPYGNYDDVQSICAVYNHCLKQDADMDFLEFIGEKLLALGIDPAEEKEEPFTGKPNQPINQNAIVQIQSGVLFQQTVQEMIITLLAPPTLIIPTTNTIVPLQEFHPGIFHPPAV